MKLGYFLSGLVIGAVLVYLLSPHLKTTNLNRTENNPTAGKLHAASWKWPDSLDAIVAAPDFHKVIFESSEFRLLEVTIAPGQIDPIHTHKGKSIIWIINTSPIVYNSFSFNANQKLTLQKKDTIRISTDKLNKGFWEQPEGPHSIENIGKNTFKLYRIEYKNGATGKNSNL